MTTFATTTTLLLALAAATSCARSKPATSAMATQVALACTAPPAPPTRPARVEDEGCREAPAAPRVLARR
jgi:hypothetical protein